MYSYDTYTMASSNALETTLTTLQVLRQEREKLSQDLLVLPYEKRNQQRFVLEYIRNRIHEEEAKLPALYQTNESVSTTTPENIMKEDLLNTLPHTETIGKWFTVDETGITESEVQSVTVVKHGKKKPRNYDGWLMVE